MTLTAWLRGYGKKSITAIHKGIPQLAKIQLRVQNSIETQNLFYY